MTWNYHLDTTPHVGTPEYREMNKRAEKLKTTVGPEQMLELMRQLQDDMKILQGTDKKTHKDRIARQIQDSAKNWERALAEHCRNTGSR